MMKGFDHMALEDKILELEAQNEKLRQRLLAYDELEFGWDAETQFFVVKGTPVQGYYFETSEDLLSWLNQAFKSKAWLQGVETDDSSKG
jgi:hypothetical protein